MKHLLTLTLLAASLSCVGQDTSRKALSFDTVESTRIDTNKYIIYGGTNVPSGYAGSGEIIIDNCDSCFITEGDLNGSLNQTPGFYFTHSDLEMQSKYSRLVKKYNKLVDLYNESYSIKYKKGVVTEDRPNIKLKDVMINGMPVFDSTYYWLHETTHTVKKFKPKSKPVQPRSYTLWYIVAGLALFMLYWLVKVIRCELRVKKNFKRN